MAAIHSRAQDAATALLEGGARVNFRMAVVAPPAQPTRLHGWTALHHAVAARSLPMLTLLLRRGADANAASDLQETPLHLAAAAGDAAAVRALLAAGADPNRSDVLKYTPLHAVAREGRALGAAGPEIIGMLAQVSTAPASQKLTLRRLAPRAHVVGRFWCVMLD